MIKKIRRRYFAIVLPVLLLMPGTAAAAENTDTELRALFDMPLRDLINMRITATKQNTSLQDVAGSIKVTTGEQLRDRDIHSLPEYASHEISMGFTRFGPLPSYYMRSIGSEQFSIATDSSVALHLDGVYLGLPDMASALLWDVNRIETLYGPQGSLYGRNAIAGAVDVISNKPVLDVVQQSLALTGGSFNRRDATYVINVPVNAEQAVRVALLTAENDGYIDDDDPRGSNQSDDERAQGIRGQWLYQPAADTEWIVSADWFGNHQNGTAGIALDQRGAAYPAAQPNADFFSTRNNLDTYDDLDTGGWNVRTNWQTDAVSWTNTLAWRTVKHDYFFNTDGTEIDISSSDARRQLDQWSNEIRAGWGERQKDGGRWLAGANLYKSNADLDFGLIRYPLNQLAQNSTLITAASVDTKAWSVFAEYEFEPVDDWFLKLGLRYSDEEKRDAVAIWNNPNVLGLSPLVPGAASLGQRRDEDRWSDVMPQLVLDHHFIEQLLTYFSVTKGFKSGGMNSFSVLDEPVEPETVLSYELGARYTSEKRDLLLSSYLFHYDYDDLQVSTIVNSAPVLSNAAQASVDGFGVAVIRQWSQWKFASNAVYRSASYDDYLAARAGTPGGVDVSGNSLPQVPRWQINSQIDYSFRQFSIPATILLRWEFRDRIYFSPYEEAEASQGATNLWFARIKWQLHEHLELSVFGDNLGDVEYLQNIVWNSSTRAAAFPEGNLIGYPAAGRTWGASLYWQFE